MGKKWWKKVTGVSGAQRKASRRLGVPLSKDGRRRKFGRWAGCVMLFMLPSVAAAILLVGCSSSNQAETPPEVEAAAPPWAYRQTAGPDGATIYIFEDKRKPPFSLNKDGSVADFEKLNAVLRFLELPPVSRNVPDQESLTNQRTDRGVYVWYDYPLGTLRIYRTLQGPNHRHYNAVWKVLVERKQPGK